MYFYAEEGGTRTPYECTSVWMHIGATWRILFLT